MPKSLEALDAAIIDRVQAAYDRVWDAWGVTVGDIACACTVVVAGTSMRWDLPGPTAILAAILVFILAGGSLHAHAQRRGMDDLLNSFARYQRDTGMVSRFASLGFLLLLGIPHTLTTGSPGILPALAFAPVLLLAGTIMTRRRNPGSKLAKAAPSGA